MHSLLYIDYALCTGLIILVLQCNAVYTSLILCHAVEEVQKKIKRIRVQYTRERQKTRKRKSGDGADDIYTFKWVHFHRLRFLDDFITAKQSVSNYRKVQYIHSYNVVYRTFSH